MRTDPTQPVPADQWDRLPTKTVTTSAKIKQPQLTKEAFVYDTEHDCYWCPNGQALNPVRRTTETRGDTPIQRDRYQAAATSCAECPLKTRCLQNLAKPREISRDQFEPHRERLAQRMANETSQQKYARRRHAAERPFAVIKHHFGARRFLLRGLKQVRLEWLWLSLASNLRVPRARPALPNFPRSRRSASGDSTETITLNNPTPSTPRCHHRAQSRCARGTGGKPSNPKTQTANQQTG